MLAAAATAAEQMPPSDLLATLPGAAAAGTPAGWSLEGHKKGMHRREPSDARHAHIKIGLHLGHSATGIPSMKLLHIYVQASCRPERDS